MTLETSLISLFAFMLTCTGDRHVPMDRCQIDIRQQGWVSKWTGSSEAVLDCEVNSTSDCPDNLKWWIVWFKFEANSNRTLRSNGKYGKYVQNAREMLIRNVTVNDSGVYYCGVIVNNFNRPGGRYVGGGTLLVVRDATHPCSVPWEYSHVKHALVWASFVVLALYSLALLVLLILKKMQRKTPFADREHGSSRKDGPIRSAQFQNVVRELYSKRNLQKHTKSMKKHSLTPVQPKDELTCSDSVDESVYQNM